MCIIIMSCHKFISCHVVFNGDCLITTWYFFEPHEHCFSITLVKTEICQRLIDGLPKNPTTMILISLLLLYPSPPLTPPFFSPSSLSGTTCLVALLSDKELTVANVGDSRGVLCDKDGNAIPLSHDHKPYQLKERKRIKKAGERNSCSPEPCVRISQHIQSNSRAKASVKP